MRQLVGLVLTIGASLGWASCKELVQGPVAIDIAACQPVAAEKLNFPADAGAKVKSGYAGVLVSARVTGSAAIVVGAFNRTGALKGETLQFFVPSKVRKTCSELSGGSWRAQVRQVCCDGHAEAPCLTPTSYLLEKMSKHRPRKRPVP